MRLTSNARALAARMRRRSLRCRSELERAARIIAPALNKEAKTILQSRVYNVKIPTRAKGTPLWRRTGNLKRQEASRADRMTVLLINAADYARPRYDLGLPGHRQPRFTASVQWHREAIAAKRDFILGARREAVLRALRG